MQDDSEYHTASEFVPDFNSDNEPPVDKEIEKKLFHKTNNLRVYKRIIKLPKRNLDLPAKCDRVDVRFAECDSEILNCDFLCDKPTLNWQLGVTDLSAAVEVALISMKRGEISIFENEVVLLDANSKERKLEKQEYFMIELIDYVTIIDLFSDRNFFKIQTVKGLGINRLSKCDKIKAKAELFDHAKVSIWKRKNEDECQEVQEIIADMINSQEFKNLNNFNKIAMDAFQTLKEKETCFFEFKNEQTFEESAFHPCELLKCRELTILTQKNKLYLQVEIVENIRFDDIFNNGSVLKKLRTFGISTASPEVLSLVYFDLKIKVNGQTAISSLFISLPQRTQKRN